MRLGNGVAAAALWCISLGQVGCQAAMQTAVSVPEGEDRQCDTGMTCPGSLVCVRLFVQQVLVVDGGADGGDGGQSGGLQMVNNYTCHELCQQSSGCPGGYTCFTTLVTPSQQVCVLTDVAARLRGDGGM